MTKRQKNYRELLAACRHQTTKWLLSCHQEPPRRAHPLVTLSRLAVRNVLRERGALGAPFQDISHITEYSLTQRLKTPVRVF